MVHSVNKPIFKTVPAFHRPSSKTSKITNSLTTGCSPHQHLFQGHFQFVHGRESLEFGADDPLCINQKDPRLRLETPFGHRRKKLFTGEILPNFLMSENDAVWHTRGVIFARSQASARTSGWCRTAESQTQ